MEVIRALEGRKSKNIDRIVFCAPPSSDLGDEPSPYAEAARSQDDNPLPRHWSVYRYLESMQVTSRETYIARQRKTRKTAEQAIQVNQADISRHAIHTTVPERTEPTKKIQNNNTQLVPDKPVTNGDCSVTTVVEPANESVELEYVSNHAEYDREQEIESIEDHQDIEEEPSDQVTETELPLPNTKRKKATSISKLNLGPARQIGISKAGVQKRPMFLKTLEENRAMQAAQKEALSAVCSTVKDGVSIDVSENNETISAGFESIAPPPSYRFALASLTSITKLLNESDQYISLYQGGKNERMQSTFNVLAIVRHVGQIELFTDWKAKPYRKEVDRCEVTVQDCQGYTLKVSLQGTCATRWTGEKQGGEFSVSRLDQTGLAEDQTSNFESFLSLDFEKTVDDTTLLVKREDSRFMPIKEGDIVHFTNLKLQRTGKQKSHPLRPSTGMEQEELKVFAIGSEQNKTTLELCWRSIGHPQKTFDSHLIHIDRRCNAIYQLHKSWSDFQ